MKRLKYWLYVSLVIVLGCGDTLADMNIPDQRPHAGQVCYANKTNTFSKNQIFLGTGNALGTITSGTWNGSIIGSSFGGAGSVSGALKANGSGTVSQAACADLSNAVASCSTDTTNATNISTGTLAAGRLPNPTASTLGGIESLVATTHQWINTISTSGVPSSTQPACADISNAGTVCTQNTGTSGANIPLLNGNNTYSGTALFTGGLPALANGNASVASSATLGGLFTGQGSTDDITFQNKSGSTICTAATGTTTLNCTGLQVGGVAVLTGNQTITLSGDTTGSGTTAITTSTVKVNGGSVPASAHVTGTNVSSQFVTATSSDIIALFSTCSGSQYLGADGVCHTASGAGTVTSIIAGAGLTGGTITSSGTIAEGNMTLAVKTIVGMNLGGL